MASQNATAGAVAAAAGGAILSKARTAPVTEAAAWLASRRHDRIGKPIVPLLREMFGLSSIQAIEAIREANLRRGQGGANAEPK